jgi:acetoin utilization protein AcuB
MPSPHAPVTRRPAVVAKDVMSSPVITIGPNESLSTAWELLYRAGFHHLVVVENGVAVGVVDDRRVVLEWPAGPLGPHKRRVCEILRPRVHCVLPDTPVSSVARVMLEEHVDAVPVVGERGEVLGLVTSSDLIGLVATGCADGGGEDGPAA